MLWSFSLSPAFSLAVSGWVWNAASSELSDVNVILALLLLAFILVAGPTLFIVELGVEGVGHMLQNFVRMSTYTDASGSSNFVEAWTVFFIGRGGWHWGPIWEFSSPKFPEAEPYAN